MERVSNILREMLPIGSAGKADTGVQQPQTTPTPAPPARQFPADFDFDERQFITIVDTDDIVEAAQNVEENAWLNPLLTGLAVTANVSSKLGPAGLAVGSGIMIAQAIYNYKRSKNDNEIIVIPVLKSEAKNLILPISHPRKKTIYAAHPGNPFTYYPLSDFHKHTFDHKFLELMKILRFLGAKSIVATYTEEAETSLSANAKLTRKSTLASGDANLNLAQTSAKSIYWSAEYPDMEIPPALPTNLVWYASELAWQEVAEARLQFSVKKFNLKLSHDNDFGVTANVAAKLATTGLKIGGEFKTLHKTSLDVSVDFWSI